MRTMYDENIKDYVCFVSSPVWVVKSVVADSDYKLNITFANGEERIYDALPLLEKKIYEPLKDLSLFMSAKVVCDTVVWNDDIDIAPEHLYECSKPVGGSSNV